MGYIAEDHIHWQIGMYLDKNMCHSYNMAYIPTKGMVINPLNSINRD